jgi:hypothetical protein
MDDLFTRILDLVIISGIPAGIVTILFRLFYGTFKGRAERDGVLRERRFYLPVAIGSFVWMFYLLYSLLEFGSYAIAFYGTVVILAAMALVFKVTTRTTWQGAFFMLYCFSVVTMVGFLPVFVLLAGAGLR